MPPKTAAPRYISAPLDHGLTFSVCSLVRDQDKYDRLLASFARKGFTAENTEFLVADNRDANNFDGYTWHRALLPEARGQFVIFCHDDIELIDDGYDDLVACLADLDQRSPDWMLAGIAGGIFRPAGVFRRPILALYHSDRDGTMYRRNNPPRQVESLDECFILMRRSRPVLNSHDLGGFHFYGADLCLQAELLGGSAHVIRFHVRHHGLGHGGQTFRACKGAFVRKYRKIFPGRSLHCTTGIVTFDEDQG
jgi:hypothetical protein